MTLKELAVLVGTEMSVLVNDGWSGYRQLMLPRTTLLAGLQPVGGKAEVKKGTMLIVPGGVPHARPPIQ